jgi:hypothetical protein
VSGDPLGEGLDLGQRELPAFPLSQQGPQRLQGENRAPRDAEAAHEESAFFSGARPRGLQRKLSRFLALGRDI